MPPCRSQEVDRVPVKQDVELPVLLLSVDQIAERPDVDIVFGTPTEVKSAPPIKALGRLLEQEDALHDA